MQNVLKFLKETVQPSSTIVLAVSGGPDSMCLLNILTSLQKEFKLKIIVAHVNHNLREESKEEAEFVEKICESKKIIFEKVELKHLPKNNTENMARQKRYAFFEELINKYQAQYLMTAHHGDDLIETILMRLTRGSSFKGYTGFAKITEKENYQIIRPFIYLTKEEILKWNRENHIEYRLDKSNEFEFYTRNRYRKNILPFLHQENPYVHQKFLKFSEELTRIEEYLKKTTETILTSLYDFDKVNLHKFNELDVVLQKRVIEFMLQQEYQNDIDQINDRHMSLIFDLINSSLPNGEVNLPLHKTLVKSYNTIGFQKKHEIVKNEYILKESVKLSPSAKIIKVKETSIQKSNYLIRLNSKEIAFPLRVRTRKSKDHMQVKNMEQPKKVKDIFINEKIPLEKRETWPIVTDTNDTIIWIPGIKKSIFDKNINENYDIIYKYVVSEEKENE